MTLLRVLDYKRPQGALKILNQPSSQTKQPNLQTKQPRKQTDDGCTFSRARSYALNIIINCYRLRC